MAVVACAAPGTDDRLAAVTDDSFAVREGHDADAVVAQGGPPAAQDTVRRDSVADLPRATVDSRTVAGSLAGRSGSDRGQTCRAR